MSNDITIPPEAFTAAETAYTEAWANGEDPIRAACLAMLKAWPHAAALTARVKELEEALRKIDIGFVRAKDAPALHDEAVRIARAALTPQQGGD